MTRTFHVFCSFPIIQRRRWPHPYEYIHFKQTEGKRKHEMRVRLYNDNHLMTLCLNLMHFCRSLVEPKPKSTLYTVGPSFMWCTSESACICVGKLIGQCYFDFPHFQLVKIVFTVYQNRRRPMMPIMVCATAFIMYYLVSTYYTSLRILLIWIFCRKTQCVLYPFVQWSWYSRTDHYRLAACICCRM